MLRQLRLHQCRKSIEAIAQIGHATGQPNAHSRGRSDHRVAAKTSRSICASTIPRTRTQPLPRSISITPSVGTAPRRTGTNFVDFSAVGEVRKKYRRHDEISATRTPRRCATSTKFAPARCDSVTICRFCPIVHDLRFGFIVEDPSSPCSITISTSRQYAAREIYSIEASKSTCPDRTVTGNLR